MNDTIYSGKKGKVQVMFVRSGDKDQGAAQDKRADRSGQRKKRVRREAPTQQADRGARFKVHHQEQESVYSGWKTLSQEQATEQGGAPEKIDPAQIRRQRVEESRVYGENACQALFKARPEAIVRAWFIQSVTPRFRQTLRWLAANRKAYHIVDDAELTKASGAEHHGGVCFIIKKRTALSVEHYLQQVSAKQDCVIVLKNIANPHNIGAIMRNCAYFGACGVLLADTALLESGAAVRTAEGGAEYIQPIDGQDLITALTRFQQAGYTIVSTSPDQGEGLKQIKLPPRIVLLLGQVEDDLSKLLPRSDRLQVSIKGAGKVEYLNIAVSSGILLAEWWQQNCCG